MKLKLFYMNAIGGSLICIHSLEMQHKELDKMYEQATTMNEICKFQHNYYLL